MIDAQAPVPYGGRARTVHVDIDELCTQRATKGGSQITCLEFGDDVGAVIDDTGGIGHPDRRGGQCVGLFQNEIGCISRRPGNRRVAGVGPETVA